MEDNFRFILGVAIDINAFTKTKQLKTNELMDQFKDTVKGTTTLIIITIFVPSLNYSMATQ